jgi:hypothetical protein
MLKESFMREERQSGHESGHHRGYDDHQRRAQPQRKADDDDGDSNEFEQVLNVQFEFSLKKRMPATNEREYSRIKSDLRKTNDLSTS